ncbi:hypothetical protein ACFL1S_08960, partial [Pseudomonadota bacterium]
PMKQPYQHNSLVGTSGYSLNFHFRQRWRGTPEADFQCHRFAYDFETLDKKLVQAGFIGIKCRNFDPQLDDSAREVGSLFLEATRA